MTNKAFHIDKLNIGLILLSALLAYLFPLALFILAFAILGPLHYLTEINWLHNKAYFFTTKNWIWLSIALLCTTFLILPKVYLFAPADDGSLSLLMTKVNNWSNSLIFLTLCLAAGYQFIKSKLVWVILIILAIAGALLLQEAELYNVIIGIFIPTIIHVYFFTLIFMLYGAKKSKSKFGYLSVALAVLIPLLLFFIPVERGSYLFNDQMKQIFIDNNFHVSPVLFAKYLGLSDGKTFYFYESLELKLMMFLSFIYCYHYLNWFSKTTVIKWHKQLNYKTTIAIILVWAINLSLFYYDFKIGLLFTLFFSFTHVLLEFPLNMMTFKGLLKR